MSKFRIRHITHYVYDEVVSDSANQIMLYPIQDEFQETGHHEITITDNPVVNVHEDYFGNRIGTFTQSRPHDQLIIDSQLSVSTRNRSMPDEKVFSIEDWNQLAGLGMKIGFIDFLKHERFESFPEIEALVEDERCKKCSPTASARHFCQYVYDNFTYRKGLTTIETTVDEIWKIKAGVCQDFAHILLVMLRMIRIPARYVSGYICPKKHGMRGEGATHAWVEAFIPNYGWLGLDPTNNCLVNDTHVRLAVGKNFSDCSPVKGTYRGTADHTLEVTVTVSFEDGNISNPEHDIVYIKPTKSEYRNSFRRHHEQMQQ